MNMNPTEMAVALYATGAPSGGLTPRRFYELVGIGTAHLGGAMAVGELAQRVREINIALMNGRISAEQHGDLVSEHFPDRGRFERLLDASHVMSLRADLATHSCHA